MRIRPALFAIVLLMSPALLAASDDPVAVRARDVAALAVAEPALPEAVFDAAFLTAVPPEQLLAIGKSLATLGTVEEITRTGGKSSLEGEFELRFSGGKVVPMSLIVGAAPAHLVVGLYFHPPQTRAGSLAELGARLAALHGQTSFAAARLLPDGPEWLGRHEGELALGVGSAFKLYVLGELAARIAAGDLAWSDVVTLQPECRSPSSAHLEGWPDGAPLTLHTLASMMIAVSDNTATDQLLAVLGREAVEARTAAMGNLHVDRNRPFLATNELFRMKLAPGDTQVAAWRRLDVDQRRAFLAEHCRDLPLAGEGIDPAALARPKAIDILEWFASAEDLCRALDALRRQGSADRSVLDVLSINPGLPGALHDFDYVGFKGGSETGVLALSFLLREDDQWYALALAWNDPAAAVEEGELLAIAGQALRLLETR